MDEQLQPHESDPTELFLFEIFDLSLLNHSIRQKWYTWEQTKSLIDVNSIELDESLLLSTIRWKDPGFLLQALPFVQQVTGCTIDYALKNSLKESIISILIDNASQGSLKSPTIKALAGKRNVSNELLKRAIVKMVPGEMSDQEMFTAMAPYYHRLELAEIYFDRISDTGFVPPKGFVTNMVKNNKIPANVVNFDKYQLDIIKSRGIKSRP